MTVTDPHSPVTSAPDVLRLTSMLVDFHRTFGQAISTVHRAQPPELPLRLALLNEEVQERAEAIEADDLIEHVDALADIVYVAAGSSLAHGITLFAPTTSLSIEDAHALYVAGTQAADIDAVAVSLRAIIGACHREAAALRIDLLEVLEEVHASNMSKVNPDGTVTRRADGKALKGPNYFVPDIAGVIARQQTT